MNEPKIRLKGFEGEWKEDELISVCEINPASVIPNSFEYVDLESVVGVEMISHRRETKDSAPSRAQRVAKDNDIFYQTVRPYQKNNYLYRGMDDMYVFSTGYAQIRSKIYPDYLFYVLQSDSFVNDVLLNCTGTSYPAINPSSLSKLHISYSSSKEEQLLISTYFKSLDTMIQKARQKIASLKQIKAASLVSMFPQDGEKTPKVRFKGFEGEWKEITMNAVFIERHEISTISSELPQLSFTIEEGVIKPENRKSNKRDFLIKDKSNKKYIVTYCDDIIYNPANVIYGAIHKNSLCNGVVSPIYKIFITNQDPTFMECIVRRPSFIKEMTVYMEGTVQKLRTLKPEAFLRMSSYIAPTLNEQYKIGRYFEYLDTQISLQQQKLEKLKQIKAACLDKMFV